MEEGTRLGIFNQVFTCVLVLAFTGLYLLGISRIIFTSGYFGFGDLVFTCLISVGESNVSGTSISYGIAVAGLSVVLLLLVYPLDVVNWGRKNGLHLSFRAISGYLFLALTTLASLAAGLLLTYKFLFLPFVVFLSISVASLGIFKGTALKECGNLGYFQAVIVGLLLSFASVLATWSVSLSQGFVYDFKTQIEYHEIMNCDSGNQTYSQYRQILSTNESFFVKLPTCNEGYMVYVSPFVFLASCFIFIVVLALIYRAEKIQKKTGNVVHIGPFARIFIGLVLLSIFGLWVAASIASITRNVANDVLWISLVVLVALFVIWVSVFGFDYFLDQLKSTSMGLKGFEFLSSDWGKGLLLFACLPVLGVFLILDFIKQFIRNKTRISVKSARQQESKQYFTDFGEKSISSFRSWNHTSVISKSLLWGIAYFVFSVGVTKIVVVFLSALRGWLDGLNLVFTSLALVGVGLLLFLLPPIPGVPVYITLGVVIPDQARDSLGFWGGLLYAIFLSFALKLLALVIQQKLIGELWGSNSVRVRQLVQINSVEIRATRKILSQQGLKFSKIVILCGGPDWPTSVLTGIMRLNVFQMLIGTTPVLAVIAPTVLSGALVVRANESDLFSVLSSISLVVTVFVQSAALLWSAQFIAQTAVKYKEELEQEEPDEEVLAIEQKNLAASKMYDSETKWDKLSSFWRIGHLTSLIFMVVSCYSFLFFSGTSFEEFDIEDSIEKELNGNALNLVKPLGWVFLSMFSFSCIYYLIFYLFFRRKVSSALNSVQQEQEENSTS